ncbi:glycosyltransferase [Gillisia sp. M10.2A]|uniref:Glycosyltransferase n=1 Tax=Gillisia lutea TaxID=2909668 RepID=A0ABS9EH34_9FLAO|nr:glycosyltransferase [Gillisia lutea]MCF4102184.1 glycosyltransferase [Gillisia lutea]
MKVIHYIGSIDQNSGGTASYMQLLTAELKKWVEIVVVTNVTANPLKLEGVKIHFIDLALLRWFQIKKEFKNILKLEKPDVLHINGIWNPQNFLVQKEAQRMGIKVVISPHGMLEPYIVNRHSTKKKIALTLYQNNAINTADYLHATAASELDNIRKLGFKKPGMIIPNGLNVSEILKKKIVEKNTPSKNILFLSRIHPKKGIELLIESISELKNQNVRVIIAGEGEREYIEELIQLTKLMGVENKIKFLGGVYGSDKWELYEQADVFVLPTYSENFGIVVIEALAAGIPVITTKGTPWEELITFNCGWWIELSVANLTQALFEAIKMSTVELEKMGERGRKLVEEKYDNKAIAKGMFQLYKNVLTK